MCGIFGVSTPHHYPAHQRLADSIAMLGVLAEERGIDSAGLALLNGTVDRRAFRDHLGRAADVRVGPWRVIRTPGRFSRISPRALHAVTNAQAVIGHTRWATQGAVNRTNASPMLIGHVLGTHNGDIDPATIPAMSPRSGQLTATDSAAIFAALSTASGDVEKISSIISGAVGRVALAWVDLRDPRQVWIARGALSPVSVGLDTHGGYWWASNPAWLRRLAQHCGIEFTRIQMISEGTLLSIAPTAEGGLALTVHAEGLPTRARASDYRIAAVAAWRGFTSADRRTDERSLTHELIAGPVTPEPVRQLTYI